MTIFFIFSIFIISCASKPQNPNACKVWSDEVNNGEPVYVENETAFYGAGCITGKIGCKWKEARFDGDDIVADGELAGMKGKIGTFKNGVFTYKPGGLIAGALKDAWVKGEEFEFKSDRVVQKSKLRGLAKGVNGGSENKETNYMTQNCTQRESVVGIGFLLSGTSQR